jgi:hypothetical protein
MQKPPQRDRSQRNTIVIALLALAVGFVAVWMYLQHAKKMDAEIRYLTLTRVAISHEGHSMAATVAIRTSGSDADWARRQQSALESAVKVALMEADPIHSRGPQGIPELQEKIRATSNKLLGTDKVQEAIITDFLVSEGDY